jgi:hypothetical protein
MGALLSLSLLPPPTVGDRKTYKISRGRGEGSIFFDIIFKK